MKKWQIVLIAIVVIGVIGAVAGGGSSDDEKKPDDPKTSDQEKPKEEEPPKEEETVFKVGDVVAVGDVEYTVTAKNAMDTIGNEYLNKKAQNMYLVIDITIKNNGDKALTVSDSFFKLLSGGKEFSTDSGGAMYLGDESIIFKEINPDASLSGKFVFDITQETIDAADLQLQVQTGVWGTEKEVINFN